MAKRLDICRIRGAVRLIKDVSPEARLSSLKNLVINNGGRWDLPSEKVGEYDPFIKSIELFGVSAFAQDVEELPKNWLIAAENILEAAEAENDDPDKDEAA